MNSEASGEPVIEFVDPDLGAQFEREGYVTCPLLDSADLDILRAEMTAHLGENLFRTNDPRGEHYATGFENSVECARFHARMADVIRPKLSRILRDFKVVEAAAMTKPPHTPSTIMHQHVAMTAEAFSRTLFLWVPLADSLPEQGGMHVVPRSQRLYRFVRTGRSGDYFESFRKALEDQFAVPVPLKAGEALLFENSLIHGAYANAAPDPRLAIVAAIFHPEQRYVTYVEDEGEIAVVDGDFSRMQAATMTQLAPSLGGGQHVVKRYPAWQRPIDLRAFVALMETGERATDAFDPLEAMLARLPVPPLPRRPLIPPAIRRLVPAAIRRRIPAAIRARLR